jgi:hypothetical protein
MADDSFSIEGKHVYIKSKKAKKAMKRSMKQWDAKKDKMFEHLNAAIQGGKLKSEFQMTIHIATDLLKSIEEAFAKSGLGGPSQIDDTNANIAVIDAQLEVYRVRAFAKAALKDWAGCIADATTGLAVGKLLRKNEQKDESKLHKDELGCLLCRGIAYREDVDRLEEAYSDLQAACDAFRLQPELEDGFWPDQSEAAMTLASVMAIRKAGSDRPHYTSNEVDQIQKDLCLRLYGKKRYNCGGCGIRSSQLLLCGRCKNAWFCGTACQKAAWKHHKTCCKENAHINVYVMSDTQTQIVEESIQSVRYFSIGQGSEMAFFVKDCKTGRYFESLTNEDVYLSPSEVKVVSYDDERFPHGATIVAMG